MASEAAIRLVLGTAAKESDFGHYLRQLGRGPARGAFQMEPATWAWLRSEYETRFPEIANRHIEEMEWDLRLATIGCRLRYLKVKEPLPAQDDIHGMARYWKRWYNTSAGRGTVDEFIEKYHEFVG